MKLTLLTLTLPLVAASAKLTSQPTPVSGTPDLPNLPAIISSAPSDYAVVARGPHSRTWQATLLATNAATGQVIARRSSYTELATGMLRQVGGAWIDSSPNLEITATGAQATNAQHNVSFLGNLNAPGAVDVTTPEGLHLTSTPLCLRYVDGNGAVAVVAQLQDSPGQILPPGNQAYYPDALAGNGVTASLLYVNSIRGLEQLAILQTKLPDPAAFGLDGGSTLLQMVTEFMQSPAPQITPAAAAYDQNLDFGIMKMVPGSAFALGSTTNRIPVSKHWLVQDNRVFLLESVPLPSVLPSMQDLPPPATASARPFPNTRFARHNQFPARPSRRANQCPLELASAQSAARGFALDYNLVTSQTNAVFQSDTTYYVSSSGVLLSGSNVFEGGTVIKFATNAAINVYPSTSTPTVTFLGSAYRPIVFTAKDDNTVGDIITGSTGTPTNYYANPALLFAGLGPVPELPYTKFLYASQALELSGASTTLSHAQFVNCRVALSAAGATAHLRNVLSTGTLTNILATGAATVTVENGTFSNSGFLESAPSSDTGSTLALTNCVLANVTNLTAGILALTGSYNGFYASTAFGLNQLFSSANPLQTAGAGTAYLADGSSFRNAATTNIDANLLRTLASKTTYPPMIVPGSGVTYLSVDTTYFPQAQRDADAPDLGFHYDAIDWALPYIYVTNATITITPGTVLTAYHTTYSGGLGINNGAQLVCQGTPTTPIRFIEGATVQEQPNADWSRDVYSFILDSISSLTPPAVINCRFTDFSSLAQDCYHVAYGYGKSLPVNVQDCQFHGGNIDMETTTLNITNCLIERVYMALFQTDAAQPVVRNCLFFGGTFDFYPQTATNGIVRDNLFDHASIPEDLTTQGYLGGFNASVSGCNHMVPGFPTDLVLLSSPAYQAGPLGNYYQLTNSALINYDTNTTADTVGLYHYTVCTNLLSGSQIKETNSWLDLSYHYAAVDTNGIPLDSDQDGIADYIEDANGNGSVDSSETDWRSATDQGLKVIITRPRNGATIP